MADKRLLKEKEKEKVEKVAPISDENYVPATVDCNTPIVILASVCEDYEKNGQIKSSKIRMYYEDTRKWYNDLPDIKVRMLTLFVPKKYIAQVVDKGHFLKILIPKWLVIAKAKEYLKYKNEATNEATNEI